MKNRLEVYKEQEIKKFLLFFILVFLPGSISRSAESQNPTTRAVFCEITQKWSNLRHTKINQNMTIKEVSNLQVATAQEQQFLAEKIFQLYRARRLPDDFFDQCFPDQDDYEALSEELPNTFFIRTLNILAQAKSPTIHRFSTTVQDKIDHQTLILFKMSGHYSKDLAPTDLKGGYARGGGSIFMNLKKIDPNEWPVILIHELLHSLDLQLTRSIQIYGDDFPAVEALVKAGTHRQPIVNEEKLMRQFLMAGLDRGFLAEYRAWTITFQIYIEGVQEGVWKNIDWLDDVLKNRNAGEPLPQFIFRYLDPRFVDPTVGLFDHTVLQTEELKIRQELRDLNAQGHAPNLYEIGKLLP